MIAAIPLLLVASPPFIATMRHRSAAETLLNEVVGLDHQALGATLVASEIDHCNDDGDRAGRLLATPVAGTDATTLLDRYATRLESAGFSVTARSPDRRHLTRDRDDDLDTDIVALGVDGASVEITTDVVDRDLVFCPPW